MSTLQWGDLIAIETGDRSDGSHHVFAMRRGGNGDLYLAIAPALERPSAWVQIVTSGGHATQMPDVVRKLWDLYQAIFEYQRTGPPMAQPATDTPIIGALADNRILAGVNVDLATQVTELQDRIATLTAELEAARAEAKRNHEMWEHWQTEAVKAQGELYRTTRERDAWRNAFDAIKGIAGTSAEPTTAQSREAELRRALVQVQRHDGPGYPQGTCSKIAADALSIASAGPGWRQDPDHGIRATLQDVIGSPGPLPQHTLDRVIAEVIAWATSPLPPPPNQETTV